MPRLGHLEQVLHIFGYLKTHKKFKLMFDCSNPQLSQNRFKIYDWEDFYRGAKEDIPTNAPKERGRAVDIFMFVDASHASDVKHRKSQTGILIFINKAPIHFYSKRQPNIEVSTFGAEFCALKLATEYVRGLRYKLRILGIRCEEPAYVYGDN